jgi:hypothetical protein
MVADPAGRPTELADLRLDAAHTLLVDACEAAGAVIEATMTDGFESDFFVRLGSDRFHFAVKRLDEAPSDNHPVFAFGNPPSLDVDDLVGAEMGYVDLND